MDLIRLRSVLIEAGTCQTKGLTQKEQTPAIGPNGIHLT